MIADWQTNCVLVADLLSQRHPVVFQQLQMILKDRRVLLKEVAGNRDIWIRDAAPIEVSSNEFVQFLYQPDYLRGYEHRITKPETFNGLSFIKRLQLSELVIDGGNVVGSTSNVILTDKVLKENPNRDRSEVEHELKQLLRVERIIFIPKEPYDVFGHSDGMVRFIDENTVIMNDYSTIDPKFAIRLRASLERHGLKIELLPYSLERRSTDGISSAVGNFVNYLRVGDLFIVPCYGIPDDLDATLRLQTLSPSATVVPLNCLSLAREGGVLQCVSWTIRVPEGETV